jgi:hypothetical protein
LADEPDTIDVQDCASLATGLEHLRAAPLDVVVIDRDISPRSPSEILLAIQTSTHEQQAVIVLSDDGQRQDAAEFLRAGAAAYLPLHSTTPAELAWQMHAAAERAALRRENQQLRAWQQRHSEQEQQEILCLLEEQAALLQQLATPLRSAASSPISQPTGDPPTRLKQLSHELLQAYVIMGRGHLAGEVRRFADRLHREGTPLATALQAFNEAIASQAADRGSRSLRHIYNRGNLLILDILLHWATRAVARESHEAIHHHSDL